MGGGARYPYPKDVWTPSGGWWSRPKNWRTNTLIAFVGIGAMSYGVFKLSAKREVRSWAPNKPIPSAGWSPNAAEIGVRKE